MQKRWGDLYNEVGFRTMKKGMRALATKYKICFTDRKFIYSVVVTFLFLALALGANVYAVSYATERASNPVTDIVLSNIPVINTDFISLYGPVLLWLFVLALSLLEPKRFPFTFKSVAFFLVIRSAFVSLTHLGVFPEQLPISSRNFISNLTTGGDLFFSGHTGLPFLLGLIYWNNKSLRYFFIIASIVFGVAVLLGHYHYSIDVLAAFFITYTIYHLAGIFFKNDKLIFDESI